jgi:hypothetical protein
MDQDRIVKQLANIRGARRCGAKTPRAHPASARPSTAAYDAASMVG